MNGKIYYLDCLPVMSENIDTNNCFVECRVGAFNQIIVNMLLSIFKQKVRYYAPEGIWTKIELLYWHTEPWALPATFPAFQAGTNLRVQIIQVALKILELWDE